MTVQIEFQRQSSRVENWHLFIHSLENEWNPSFTQSQSQILATAAESPLLRPNLALGIKTVVMEMVSIKFYGVNNQLESPAGAHFVESALIVVDICSGW
jgi:hypothetical protein